MLKAIFRDARLDMLPKASQQCGKYHDQIFASLVQHSKIKTLPSVATNRIMNVRHLDVSTVLLCGEIQEYIRLDVKYLERRS